MAWFKDLSIAKKLLYSFLLIIAFLFFLGIFAQRKLSNINDSAYDLDTNWVPSVKYTEKLAIDIGKIRRKELVMLVPTTPAEIAKAQNDLLGLRKTLADDRARYEKMVSEGKERELYTEFSKLWDDYTAVQDRIMSLVNGNQTDEAITLNRSDSKKLFDAAEKKCFDLSALNEKGAADAGEQIHAMYDSAKTWMYVVMLVSIIIALWVANSVSKYIKNGLAAISGKVDDLSNIAIANLAKGSEQLGKGDLNIHIDATIEPLEIDSTDELGKLASNINLVITNTDRTVAALRKAAGAIKDAIEQSNNMVDAAKEGKLSMRGAPEHFSGSYRTLIEGLNATLDAIVQPITESGKTLAELAQGDLSQRMAGDYKGDFLLIKNSINTVAESLDTALGQVHESIAATASAASEISSSSEQMAAGAQEQSAQTSEIASAVEEMTKTIFESTKNAGVAADHSKKASDNAKEGAKKIEATKQGMHRIVESTKETGKIINSLAHMTDQIGEITQVIDDIADQTNLLALNAAIEAARAGEQGRGFAVVADEVRKLAERTTKATKEIAETIKTVQKEAKDADKSMNEAGNLVKVGMDLTEEVAKVLVDILEMNERVAETVSQLAASSEEQSATAEEISKNIDSISSVIHESAAGTGQIAKAAEDLNRLTTNLQALIQHFHLTGKENFSANRMASLQRPGHNKKLLTH